uniref:Ig-like domain-containing protein n=1 Tax=Macrostomum lignano TaxID=282301 RepID=A0A1I8JMR2_9PLAT
APTLALGDGQLISAGRWFESSPALLNFWRKSGASLTWQIRTNGGSGFESVEADSTKGASRDAVRSELSTIERVVRCLATNPVANLSSPDYVLNVLYLPVVTAVPSLAIELGARGRDRCARQPEIRSPLFGFENGRARFYPGALPPDAHQPSQSGTYRCVGDNRLGASNASFAIDIQYGPKRARHCDSSSSGDQLTIQCSADANPAAPSSSVVWTHLSSGRSKSDVGATLVIRKVDRSDAGVWRCRFANTLTPSSGAAGAARWSGRHDGDCRVSSGTAATSAAERQLIRGQNACRLPGFGGPNPARYFESAGRPTLALANVSLSDSGVYFCTPSNAAGHGPTTSISFGCGAGAPEWLEPQPRETKSASVTDSKDFRLVCTARAKPEPSFAWYKDGKLIPAEWFSVETSSVSEDAGLREYVPHRKLPEFSRRPTNNGQLRPEDNGRYLCEASNRRGKISARIPLVVEFKPQIAPVETKIAKPEGTSVGLHLPLFWPSLGPPSPGNSLCQPARLKGPNGTRSADRVAVTSSGWDFVTLSWSTAFSGGSPVQYWSRVLTKDRATGQVRNQHETLRHLDFD